MENKKALKAARIESIANRIKWFKDIQDRQRDFEDNVFNGALNALSVLTKINEDFDELLDIIEKALKRQR
jgi:hypothetical protein